MKLINVIVLVVFGCALMTRGFSGDCGTKASTKDQCTPCKTLGEGASCSYTESDQRIYCCYGGSDERCDDYILEDGSSQHVMAKTRSVTAICKHLGNTWGCSPTSFGPWSQPFSRVLKVTYACGGG